MTAIKRQGQNLSVPESTSYTYTPTGSRASMSLPNGVHTQYGYDARDRLVSLVHTNASGSLLAAYTYTLDQAGRRVSAHEVIRRSSGLLVTNHLTYTYDAAGRLTQEVAQPFGSTNGYTASYSYDLVGNRLERRVTAGARTLTTTYAYDDNDRLLWESNAVATAFSGSGKAGRAFMPMRVLQADGSEKVIYRARPAALPYYVYRSVPWFLAAGFLLPAFLLPVGRWQKLRVLTSDLHPERALFPHCLTGFLAALMVFICVDSGVLADEAALYALSTSTWADDGSVITYQYDDNGSVTRKVTTGPSPQTVEYAYALQNKLASAVTTTTSAGSTVVTTTAYLYDYNGNRVRSELHKAVNGQETTSSTNIFLLDALNSTGLAQVLEELPAVGATPATSYTIGDDIISQTKPGAGGQPATDWLLYDGHGSTRQAADALGQVTESYSYDSYGMMIGGNPTSEQPARTSLLYTGQQFDSALQQYYLRARNYDPSNGRFNALDPFMGSTQDPQSLHKYAYVHGDPVNGSDPSGMVSLTQVVMATSIIGTLVTSFGFISGMTAHMWSRKGWGKLMPDAIILSLSWSWFLKGFTVQPGLDFYLESHDWTFNWQFNILLGTSPASLIAPLTPLKKPKFGWMVGPLFNSDNPTKDMMGLGMSFTAPWNLVSGAIRVFGGLTKAAPFLDDFLTTLNTNTITNPSGITEKWGREVEVGIQGWNPIAPPVTIKIGDIAGNLAVWQWGLQIGVVQGRIWPIPPWLEKVADSMRANCSVSGVPLILQMLLQTKPEDLIGMATSAGLTL